MRNIFILYMPTANTEAMVHYEDTIRKKVAPSKILPLVSSSVSRKLAQIFGQRPIAVWGSRDSSSNRAKFDRMNEGDEILIVEGQTIKLLGRVACKDVNPRLSQELPKHHSVQFRVPCAEIFRSCPCPTSRECKDWQARSNSTHLPDRAGELRSSDSSRCQRRQFRRKPSPNPGARREATAAIPSHVSKFQWPAGNSSRQRACPPARQAARLRLARQKILRGIKWRSHRLRLAQPPAAEGN